jgi:hypothetical protein
MDLLDYHLKDADGGFEPQLEWRRPRPQICFAIALMAIDTVESYFAYVMGDQIPEPVGERLADVREHIFLADKAHENLLSNRQSAE